MVDTIRIKRRAAGGAAGPPSSLAAAELAFNEQDNVLYYGKGNSAGAATSILAIGGDAKQPLDAELTAIAGLTSAANKVPYFSGAGAAAVADFIPGAWVSFTPTIAPSGTPGAFAITSPICVYCKIGRLVFEKVRFTVSNIGTGTGLLTGLYSNGLQAASGTETYFLGRNLSSGKNLTGRAAAGTTYYVGTFAETPGYPAIATNDILLWDLVYEATS